MPTWVVVMLAVIAGILAVLLIFILFFCFRSKDKKQPPSPAEPNRRIPARQESTIGIRPKITNPIYTINANRLEKENSRIADTLTTRKLSMMFDSKKRFSTAFSHKSAYFDFENSPLPRHKEYLDFNDIENMIPAKKAHSSPDRPSLDFLNEIREAHSNTKKASTSSTVETTASSSSTSSKESEPKILSEDEFNKSSTRPVYVN